MRLDCHSFSPVPIHAVTDELVFATNCSLVFFPGLTFYYVHTKLAHFRIELHVIFNSFRVTSYETWREQNSPVELVCNTIGWLRAQGREHLFSALAIADVGDLGVATHLDNFVEYGGQVFFTLIIP